MRRTPKSVRGLEDFGRIPLSPNFFLRDFLYSDIATIHGLRNLPDDPDLAITAGSKLCTELLEPLQGAFGRIAIRSAYRSPEVNEVGNRLYASCARNASDYAGHIWDRRDADGCMGAMASIIVPRVFDRFHAEGDWRKLAWWIHDHLPYSRLQFFPKLFAFNIGWHERPKQRIDSFAQPRGLLTKPGMANHAGSHEAEWHELRACMRTERPANRSDTSERPN